MTAPASPADDRLTSEAFTNELRQWALGEIAAARAPDEVLRELIARGIPEELAVDNSHDCLSRVLPSSSSNASLRRTAQRKATLLRTSSPPRKFNTSHSR